MKIFENWTDQHSQSFGKEIIAVQHRIGETGLFSDDALAEMLDKHPANNLDVCTMANDQELFPTVSVLVIFAIVMVRPLFKLRRPVKSGSTLVKL